MKKQQQAKSNALKAPQKDCGRGQTEGAKISQPKTQSLYDNLVTSCGCQGILSFKHKGSCLYVPLRLGANAV